jgi:hypothetical protein
MLRPIHSLPSRIIEMSGDVRGGIHVWADVKKEDRSKSTPDPG